jgi:hypothetical protein
MPRVSGGRLAPSSRGPLARRRRRAGTTFDDARARRRLRRRCGLYQSASDARLCSARAHDVRCGTYFSGSPRRAACLSGLSEARGVQWHICLVKSAPCAVASLQHRHHRRTRCDRGAILTQRTARTDRRNVRGRLEPGDRFCSRVANLNSCVRAI